MTKTCPHCDATVLSTSQPDAGTVTDESGWPPQFELMKLQVRKPDGGDWIDIFPIQLEQMLKHGCDVRVIEPPAALAATPAEETEIHPDGDPEIADGEWPNVDNDGEPVGAATPAVGGERVSFRRQWLQTCYYQMANMKLPSGYVGDWLFLFREQIKDALDKPAQPASLCSDCPPAGYPTDETRCLPCPRRDLTHIDLVRFVGTSDGETKA